MILESLHALSEKRGFLNFKEFSQIVTFNSYGSYLTAKVFGFGRNPGDWFAPRLLSILAREGVDSDHAAVRWTQLYQSTRGLEELDFDFYLEKFKLLSGDRISESPILSKQEKHMALTIAYALTGGRSWMTGEKLSFDEAMLHHILHDENGYTLYGMDYENRFEYFVCLNKDGENAKMEGTTVRQYWEDKFIFMWQQFKAGNYKAATEHWNDFNPQNQMDFLRVRKSMRYLDNWLEKL
jgi:hypothetical protein